MLHLHHQYLNRPLQKNQQITQKNTKETQKKQGLLQAGLSVILYK